MKANIQDHTGLKNATLKKAVSSLVDEFAQASNPLEQNLILLLDARTRAIYLECHIRASKLIELGTVDVPLDPDEQAEYRANRDLVEDHAAFAQMKDDAVRHRTFSNLVCEFSKAFEPEHPLKIVGGQHRFTAIREALSQNIDELHGLKVYFELDNDQRIDVQLISNTKALMHFLEVEKG